MRHLKILFAASLFGLLAGQALSPLEAKAAETLKLAHASSEDSLINQAAKLFAEKVATATSGAVKVQIFPNGQLGDEGPIADGVGVRRDRHRARRRLRRHRSQARRRDLAVPVQGRKAVHAYPRRRRRGPSSSRSAPTAGTSCSARSIPASATSPAARARSRRRPTCKGLKIRTPPNPVILATMKQLGALPQSVPFGEVYTALQSKVVDAVEPEIRDFYDQKWYESVKYRLGLQLHLDAELLVHEQG